MILFEFAINKLTAIPFGMPEFTSIKSCHIHCKFCKEYINLNLINSFYYIDKNLTFLFPLKQPLPPNLAYVEISIFFLQNE